MRFIADRYIRVALSFAGSATLLLSCGEQDAADKAASDESMMTEYSENLSIVNSENGRRSYHFVTPLLEGYSLAREPYREFRKGVKMTTFKNDSLSSVDGVLTANYAIYYENRKLWEARGDVVVEKSDGKTLYTQQLFWNERTKRIYSNVDTRIVQDGGRNDFLVEGFESDEEFKDWRYRRMKGRMEVEMKPGPGDTTASAGTVERPVAPPHMPAPEAPARSVAPSRRSAAPRDAASMRLPEPSAPVPSNPAPVAADRLRPLPEAETRPADGERRLPLAETSRETRLADPNLLPESER